MKIDRLIGILSVLLQNEKVTAPYLAEKFEVSRRTINRDIEDLCKAGIPLLTTQGAGGGISIMEGYKMDKTLFTSKEMQAILAGLRSLDSIAHNNGYKCLIQKLDGKSDNFYEESCYDASGHILINLSSHYKSTLAPKIELIRRAIEEKYLIIFEYYYPKGESVRIIEPYLLVFEWGNWYVWGYCTERKDFRMFKLNRMLNLIEEKKTFIPHELPSFHKQIDQYFNHNSIHIVAQFQTQVKWRIIEEYGIESFRETKTGELIFEMDFSNKGNFFTWILGFGDKAKILEPIELQKEYIDLVERMRNIYMM